MKTLMLGWEFPPHISGGLGTACYGLTQGLHEHGVGILFVVPRRFGDEDQRAIKLLSCEDAQFENEKNSISKNSAVLPGNAKASPLLHSIRHLLPAASTNLGTDTYSLTQRNDPSPTRDWQTLAIDSALRPYLNSQSFQDGAKNHLFAHEFSPSEPLFCTNENHLQTPSQSFTRPGNQDDSPQSGQLDPLAKRDEKSQPGQYGTNLLEEVARYAQATASLASKHSHDVIHAHDWMTYPAAIWARLVSGRPLVVHLHATEFDRSGENINHEISRIEKQGLEAADRVICVSHYTSAQIQRRYGIEAGKIRVVHNAVNQTRTTRFSSNKSIPEPIVLFLGRVTFQKGPDYFLEAARRVIQVEKHVKFVMAGNGDMLPAMIERAAEMGLAEHVHFTGFLSGEDVERMYAMADLYIMPSVSEPFGIAPLEAMAQNVPVIISKQSGVSEVLNHALKVDFWDVNDIASKILAVLRLPSLRENLVEGGHEEISHMQWSLRGEKIRTIYEELMS